jgi:hypothetical protein
MVDLPAKLGVFWCKCWKSCTSAPWSIGVSSLLDIIYIICIHYIPHFTYIYIYVTSTTFFASTNNGLLATEQAAGWACWSTARHGANDQTIQRRFFSSAVSVESSATNSGLIYLKEVIYEKKHNR